MIRVLVVEDSPTAREYLVAILEDEPGIEVVGAARDGAGGVELAERLRPDVVLMDVHMPRVDGYEATRLIMERCPTRIVMVSASVAHDELKRSFQALEAGALTLIDKPAGLGHPNQEAMAAGLVQTVRLMAEVNVVRRWARKQPAAAALPAPAGRLSGRRSHVIALGASTGGPAVVASILRAVPKDIAAPILYVQHIAAGFVQGLCDWLSGETGFPVRLATDGEPARAGQVFVAPDRLQLGLGRDGYLRLADAADPEGFRPSASWVFRSVAESHGARAAGVLLTGMGRDGASGLLALRQAGAVTIAQDEASSPVFGMPAEAIRLGAAEHVLDPAGIAAALAALTDRRRKT